MNHEGRIERLAQKIAGSEADALLVTNLTNVRYLTGFSGTAGSVLVLRDGAVFMTDTRYEARAGSLVKGAEIDIYPSRLTESLVPRLQNAGVKRLSIEALSMTVADRADLAERTEGVELVSSSGLVEDLRRTKDEDEVECLRRAVKIGDEAYSWLLDRLEPGVTERQVALDLEVFMRQNGADEISFEPIVGSGELSAHIHHTPSDRPLDKGDLVILDFGARVDGYCSDMTRTVVLGAATEDQIASYELVLAAHDAGIRALRPGAACAEVDADARGVIEDAGRGEEFAHGLGHGVGLDIHEAPKLHRISDESLREGDVVTVEPGVYAPSWGGIRIEDCVLVTGDGAEVLGSAPKDRLIEI